MTSDWISLQDRAGYLRLYGRESLSSLFQQSLIARRVEEHHTEAATCLQFSPTTFQQMAGLVCHYNTYHYHYCHLYGDEDGQSKFLNIISCDNHEISESLEVPLNLTGAEDIYLMVEYRGAKLQFYYGLAEGDWTAVGPVLDGSILSDEYVRDEEVRYRPAFTGAFVGICCQDLSGRRCPADFKWFSYRNLSG